ncbi:hypothetical protein NP233_g11844 [Leucocoprinus birnbaumii]|uniref:C2H2-type domain-containing protein n=1 Tax=Leucocoprinus birnbaumii TaxID=56174 RepID=A0AAD5YQK0_9AGAR|nr:hypothetical protein NP233_g11844 [Leucocoprinus birnbaumii]
MAYHDPEDLISISIEPPFEEGGDIFGLSQPLPAVGHDFFNDHVGNFQPDAMLSPFALDSPLSEGYSPSSPESLHSFASSHDSPLYSPQTLSGLPSPFSTASDLGDTPHPTVAPKDIMSNDIGFWISSAEDEYQHDSIEPLLEECFEDPQSQALVAIDRMDSPPPTSSTLFAAQKTTDLRITIPSVSPSRATSPISPYPISPSNLSVPSPHKERSLSPAASDSQDSDYASPLSRPLSSLSGYESNRSRRRGSTASDSSLRVRSSPKRGSPRQHPYTRPLADLGYAAAAQAAGMTQANYMLVVEALREKEAHKGWDWTAGLPTIVKPVVGSAQTRRASEERRTDSASFGCPIHGCGANITKKHNLMYHLQSHFEHGSAFICSRCQRGISHSASLRRHERAHEVRDAKEAGLKTKSSGNGNKKKRTKKQRSS